MIKNITKKTIIAQNAFVPSNFTGQLKGMIGGDMEAIILKTRFGIHTFLMRFAIDILILDDKKKVVAIKENLVPNSLFFWNPRFENVIELRARTIKQSKTSIGDQIHY